MWWVSRLRRLCVGWVGCGGYVLGEWLDQLKIRQTQLDEVEVEAELGNI